MAFPAEPADDYMQEAAATLAGAPDTLADLALWLDADPLNVALHKVTAGAMRNAGDETGFLAHRIAVETFNAISAAAAASGSAAPIRSALPLYNLATAFYMKGDNVSALRWYEHTLDIEPDLAIAHQNLAAVLDLLNRPDDAQAHRSRAYSLQRVYIEPSDHAPRRVLILCAGRTSGNIPFDTLLPLNTSYRIKYAIDCASDAEDFQLPRFDLVFNAIGEPDIAKPLTQRLENFVRRCNRPLLNRPAAVLQTQRDRLPGLLGDLDDVLIAPCMRLARPSASRDELDAQLAAESFGFPLLLRPLAKHGGDGLTLHQSIDTLWPAVEALNAPCYLTMFRNYRSADGHFRKYRRHLRRP